MAWVFNIVILLRKTSEGARCTTTIVKIICKEEYASVKWSPSRGRRASIGGPAQVLPHGETSVYFVEMIQGGMAADSSRRWGPKNPARDGYCLIIPKGALNMFPKERTVSHVVQQLKINYINISANSRFIWIVQN
jgi:hypothetical protein